MIISNLFSFAFKYRILFFLQRFKRVSFFEDKQIAQDIKHIFFFLAADYGNLGDVAITYAQTEFLKKHRIDHQIVEIPISQSLEGIYFVKKHIKNEDLITLVGGGNLGDRYDQIEFIRQLVVQFFPNHKIISFPQTFDFSNTLKGNRALKKAKKIYNGHKNLTLVAREEISYRKMQEYFRQKIVILTSYILLILNK